MLFFTSWKQFLQMNHNKNDELITSDMLEGF